MPAPMRIPCIFEIQTVFAGFHVLRVWVWLFDLRAVCSNYSKTPKSHSTTAAVDGLETDFAADQG